MLTRKFLCIDVGTTSVKTSIVDEAGSLSAVSTCEYSLETPSEGIVEIDPEIYWENVVRGVRESLYKSPDQRAAVSSIGISSQGETFICLDRYGKPLRKAIVWMDSRASKEADAIKYRFGNRLCQSITGQPEMTASWPISKMLWLKENQPDVFKSVYKFVLVEDYLIYRLTGKFVGEYSLYTSSCMLDIRKKRWWQDALDFVGVRPDQLVELSESGRIVGNITSSAASELGLSNSVVVVTGAMDQTAGMLGAGNVSPGIVTETTGAALAICSTLEKFPDDPGQMAIQYHAVADKFLALCWCPTGGMALKWLRDKFFDGNSYDDITALAESVEPGSQGLFFFPFLAGSGTPLVETQVKGAFVGLELHHGKAHFCRAVLESIGFVLKQNLDAMEQIGISCCEIRSLGGGSKSAFWNKIKADITGKRILKMHTSETALVGVALLQAAALEPTRKLENWVKGMVSVDSVIEPAVSETTIYKPFCNRYNSFANGLISISRS